MTTPPEMAAAMARLWEKFLPEMEQRVVLIEEAAQALKAGSLTEAQREAAHAAAHKLAGSLGLFGMAQGTEIARGLEALLETTPLDADGLSDGARELRAVIATRN
ncbi:MAG TPA: Hpt domain-containing protein [Acidobacteriaceae bacterium]|nr:Hpt domain-containing protein [Acidobacteriaceae bacterium]